MNNLFKTTFLLTSVFLLFNFIALSQSIETTKLEMIIGKVQGFYNGQLVYTHSNFHHIKQFPAKLDSISETVVDSICFQLGVDSLQHEEGLNTNGLSPANGMYWAWQSGYIFVKWEGYVMKESEKVLQPFTYHLGGFQFPYRCDQLCSMVLKKSKPLNEIQLYFKPTHELIQFVLESDFEIMSPQPAAVQMMKLFDPCLVVQ